MTGSEAGELSGSRAAAVRSPAITGGAAAGRRLSVVVVGISVSANCGVRDHARRLGDALAAEGVECSFWWLDRAPGSFGATRKQLRGWLREVHQALERDPPDAILLHYSVFSYSYKGLPVFVRPVFAALAGTAPVFVLLHEFAYPWFYGGWRGALWAVTQRLATIEVMRASAGAIATVDVRADWLRTRRWLPSRPVLSAPVFSNLPDPSAGVRPDPGAAVVGLFGYSYQGAAVSLVVEALAAVRAARPDARLLLLGAPGAHSPAGAAWRAAAERAGFADALLFTGPLPAQELSDALASSALLLFADTAGPSSRKTTLAASLAAGRPVVAVAGPMGWRRMIDGGAIRVAEPTVTGLSSAILDLLGDADAGDELGRAGRDFYEREMEISRTATAVRGLLARQAA